MDREKGQKEMCSPLPSSLYVSFFLFIKQNWLLTHRNIYKLIKSYVNIKCSPQVKKIMDKKYLKIFEKCALQSYNFKTLMRRKNHQQVSMCICKNCSYFALASLKHLAKNPACIRKIHCFFIRIK